MKAGTAAATGGGGSGGGGGGGSNTTAPGPIPFSRQSLEALFEGVRQQDLPPPPVHSSMFKSTAVPKTYPSDVLSSVLALSLSRSSSHTGGGGGAAAAARGGGQPGMVTGQNVGRGSGDTSGPGSGRKHDYIQPG